MWMIGWANVSHIEPTLAHQRVIHGISMNTPHLCGQSKDPELAKRFEPLGQRCAVAVGGYRLTSIHHGPSTSHI